MRRRNSPADEAYEAGVKILTGHPLFATLLRAASLVRSRHGPWTGDGLAFGSVDGVIQCNPKARATPEEWAYVIAHCLLHYPFGHFTRGPADGSYMWNAACDAFVSQFLDGLKIGRCPDFMAHGALDLPANEEALYDRFVAMGVVPSPFDSIGTGGPGVADMTPAVRKGAPYRRQNWEELFARGLQSAVTAAVQVAGGVKETLNAEDVKRHPAEAARQRFMTRYPLLGAVAAGFRLIVSLEEARRYDVSLASIDIAAGEILVNPLQSAGIMAAEWDFIMAHELLHAALGDDARRMGRDPYLWNIACDFRINDWLIQMEIGSAPEGVLFDVALRGLSAEEIYVKLVDDVHAKRRQYKTFRGSKGDMLSERSSESPFVDMDEICRRALLRGFEAHQAEGRGFLPAGLVAEIRALAQPPIPWEVELGRWFDRHFPPVEKIRSWRRLSRRQAATPDIPRPAIVRNPRAYEGRTFGVIVDTSGSMGMPLIGKAIGAIGSYATAREVSQVRLVFCDAAPYDQGYVTVSSLLGRIKVKGFGGTVLQPGIDLLQAADDFPDHAPILIITDAGCDRFSVSREHAIMIPKGTSLPFNPKGPVFRVK